MLMLLHPLVLIVLVGRAAFTADPPWRRIGAVVVVGFALLWPHFAFSIGGTYGGFMWVFVLLLPGLYLLSWAFRSRDHAAIRAVSALLGLAATVPILFMLLIPTLILLNG